MFKDTQDRQSDIVSSGDGHRRHFHGSMGWSTTTSPSPHQINKRYQSEFLSSDVKVEGDKYCFADCFGIRFCRWIFGCAIALASLWGLAVSCHRMATTLELNAGETIRIPLLPLWSRTILQIKSNKQDPGLEIYQFSPVLENEVAECPLLNGPSVNVESKQTFTLNHTQFVYDSFHLNAGSTIMLDARQHHHPRGLTNIYLLRGFRHLEPLKHHEESSHDFRAYSIRKALVGKQGGAALRYQVEEDDFYIIVYSNDSWESKASHLKVIVNITLSTHSLENERPVCTARQTMNDGCFWDLLNNRYRRQLALSCLVAKAVSAEIDTATNTTRFIDNTTGLQESVVFQIGGPFRYELLFWLTISPLMLGLFWLTAKTTSAWLHQQKYSPGALYKSSSEQTLLNDMQQLSSSSSETSYQAIESS
jgi:hypothetical protein